MRIAQILIIILVSLAAGYLGGLISHSLVNLLRSDKDKVNVFVEAMQTSMVVTTMPLIWMLVRSATKIDPREDLA